MTFPSEQRIAVIIGSTRPTRICPSIAAWTRDALHEQSPPRYELIDLAELDLPMLDEPFKAALHGYQQPHTKAWSKQIDSYSGFEFVLPQYNWGFRPAEERPGLAREGVAVNIIQRQLGHTDLGTTSDVPAGHRPVRGHRCRPNPTPTHHLSNCGAHALTARPLADGERPSPPSSPSINPTARGEATTLLAGPATLRKRRSRRGPRLHVVDLEGRRSGSQSGQLDRDDGSCLPRPSVWRHSSARRPPAARLDSARDKDGER